MLEKLNRLMHGQSDQYSEIGLKIMSHTLSGFWSRVLVVILVLCGIWFGLRRGRIWMILIFFGLALIVIYAGGLVNLLAGG